MESLFVPGGAVSGEQPGCRILPSTLAAGLAQQCAGHRLVHGAARLVGRRFHLRLAAQRIGAAPPGGLAGRRCLRRQRLHRRPCRSDQPAQRIRLVSCAALGAEQSTGANPRLVCPPLAVHTAGARRGVGAQTGGRHRRHFCPAVVRRAHAGLVYQRHRRRTLCAGCQLQRRAAHAPRALYRLRVFIFLLCHARLAAADPGAGADDRPGAGGRPAPANVRAERALAPRERADLSRGGFVFAQAPMAALGAAAGLRAKSGRALRQRSLRRIRRLHRVQRSAAGGVGRAPGPALALAAVDPGARRVGAGCRRLQPTLLSRLPADSRLGAFPRPGALVALVHGRHGRAGSAGRGCHAGQLTAAGAVAGPGRRGPSQRRTADRQRPAAAHPTNGARSGDFMAQRARLSAQRAGPLALPEHVGHHLRSGRPGRSQQPLCRPARRAGAVRFDYRQ